MKKYEHCISVVEPGSIADELELQPGDVLLKINNQEIKDIFDYHYLVEDEFLTLLIKKENGEQWELEIEKDFDQDLGIQFENSLMDEYRSCHNKCIFCFIDQNPHGMRDTIYFKDDDSRLSFLQGNYITLTNMSDADVERIIEYKLAPINISVHTTNPKLRCQMLNNRFAGDALKKIDRFFEAGIPMNGQIVLCKHYNDGDELRRTLKDLMQYLPCIQSVSVVPVGLSDYREGLCELEPFNAEDACEVIDIIEGYQKEAFEKFGTHFVHASDEWYIKAGRPFPEEERYDGYIQLENGVGMSRLFLSEIDEGISEYLEYDEVKERLAKFEADGKKYTVSTIAGMIALPMIEETAQKIMQAFPFMDIHVYGIRNDFFGNMITVTGLLTGGDIMKQLTDKVLGEKLLLPCCTLKADEDIFLDDVTLETLRNTLQVPVDIVESSGVDFVRACVFSDVAADR